MCVGNSRSVGFHRTCRVLLGLKVQVSRVCVGIKVDSWVYMRCKGEKSTFTSFCTTLLLDIHVSMFRLTS